MRVCLDLDCAAGSAAGVLVVRAIDRLKQLNRAHQHNNEPTMKETLHRLSRWPDSNDVSARIGQINRAFAGTKGAFSRGKRK